MNCQECSRFDKKIKVMLSDHEFQLRKLAQDKAEEKALFEINIQKELRKWQEKYYKEKTEHEEDCKKWLNKIDQTTLSCQIAVQQAKKLTNQTICYQRMQTKSFYESKMQGIKQNYESEINQLKNNHEQQLLGVGRQHQNKIVAIESKYQSEIDRLKLQSSNKQKTLTEESQIKINMLENQKLTEEKMNAKLQEDHRRERSKYLGEIYDQKVIVSTLQESINTLKTSIVAKEKEISRKQQEIKQINQEFENQKLRNQKDYQKIRKQFEEELSQQKTLFFEKQLLITQKYEESVKNIEQKRQYQQKLYESNLVEIKTCIDNRPSRVEDVEEILIVREKLSRKERQYQLLEREMKNYQLQLQNKEDTYNKIFMPSVNSTHLNDSNSVKKKQLRVKRAGKSVSTVRDILGTANLQSGNNLPALTSIDKKMLPPRSVKIL